MEVVINKERTKKQQKLKQLKNREGEKIREQKTTTKELASFINE
jgi:hypothetical protein